MSKNQQNSMLLCCVFAKEAIIREVPAIACMKAKEFCEKWGTTHQDLADLLKVRRSTVSNWIAGISPEPEEAEQHIDFWHEAFLHMKRMGRKFKPGFRIFVKCEDKGKGTEFDEEEENDQS